MSKGPTLNTKSNFVILLLSFRHTLGVSLCGALLQMVQTLCGIATDLGKTDPSVFGPEKVSLRTDLCNGDFGRVVISAVCFYRFRM